MSGDNGCPNDENDYERGAREERARIEAEVWGILETTPKDGWSGMLACIRGLVGLAKTVTRGAVTNLEIEKKISEEARCDIRTARRALEHGYGTIRRTDLRDRLAIAIRHNIDLVKQYSKEHYP